MCTPRFVQCLITLHSTSTHALKLFCKSCLQLGPLENFVTRTSPMLDLCSVSLCHEAACTAERDLFKDLSIFSFVYHSLNLKTHFPVPAIKIMARCTAVFTLGMIVRVMCRRWFTSCNSGHWSWRVKFLCHEIRVLFSLMLSKSIQVPLGKTQSGCRMFSYSVSLV